MSQQHNQTDEAIWQPIDTGHPKPATYFKVAITLVILTGVEVAALSATWLQHGIFAVLGLLSVAKFILVAQYYMHLKFDSRIFSTMFVSGLVLASLIIFTLMGLLHFFVAS